MHRRHVSQTRPQQGRANSPLRGSRGQQGGTLPVPAIPFIAARLLQLLKYLCTT